MLWPSTVELAGVSIPLEDILAELVIHHGRGDISDEPTATTCQLALHGVDQSFVAAFDVGQSLVVTVSDGLSAPVPRFTGSVTDATLDGDRLTVIAAGLVSKLGDYVIGKVDWPAETWSARVTRCFAEAGLSSRLELHPDPAFNPQLVGRTFDTAGETTLGDYLPFLAGMVGALVSDRMDGRILVQAIGARTLAGAVELEPSNVAYAPTWQTDLPRGNILTVRYTGDQSEHVTATDSVSVGLYGPRPETIDTTFESSADATARANQRLGRAAYSRWTLPATELLTPEPGLELGAAVTLTKMPAAAPFDPWTPMLEGWTDDIAGAEWRQTLALSDPLLSGTVLPWSSVPTTAEYRWNTVDPATDWTEALTLEDLDAG